MDRARNGDEFHQPLLTEPRPEDKAKAEVIKDEEEENDLTKRVLIESKKLWVIVGPSIISRVASYSMNIITQAFAGHLGDVELAAISIANTVIVGFNFGLLHEHQWMGDDDTNGFLGSYRVALIFTSSSDVLREVDKLSYLLGITILLNSVQPVLSGVAIGSGWQATVAYVNIACYYVVGLPLGFLMGWVFDLGVGGIWGGMIFGGTFVQTVILAILTIRSDWEKEAQTAKQRVEKWGGDQVEQ
ncbi:Multi antimicrobial extrusion protein [Corchorus capsularis]|uniref:Multi antimicrobial extrusion protein n=1 Tax=Corchorus capsularis TaxID=210143 RepID=A0A1R3HG23_COCAP|nr:Multi antimicrobial extrusion protein [Corchorus capsularis]